MAINHAIFMHRLGAPLITFCDDVTVDCKCMLVSHNCDTRLNKVISKSLGIDFIDNKDFIFDDTHGRSCKEMHILYVAKFTKVLASEHKHLWFHTTSQKDVLHIKTHQYHLSNGRKQQLLIQVYNKNNLTGCLCKKTAYHHHQMIGVSNHRAVVKSSHTYHFWNRNVATIFKDNRAFLRIPQMIYLITLSMLLVLLQLHDAYYFLREHGLFQ